MITVRCTDTELSLVTGLVGVPYFSNLSVLGSQSSVFLFRFLEMAMEGEVFVYSFVVERNCRRGFQILPRDCHFKQLEIYPFAVTFETPIEIAVN